MQRGSGPDSAVGFDRVFAEELRCIRRRWNSVYAHDEREAESDSPAPGNGLVGLALSGGGLRSATFNLGLLQGLHDEGVFEHVDYLSTVGGGGYVGSSLSAAMRRLPGPDEDPESGGGEFPFAPAGGLPASGTPAGSPPFVSWQRSRCNITSFEGFLDLVRVGAVVLRGMLLNFLVLLPILLVFSVLMVWNTGSLLARWEALDQQLASARSEAGKAAAEADRAEIWAIGGNESDRAAARTARARADTAAREAQALAASRPAATSLFRLSPAITGLFLLLVVTFPVLIRLFKVYRRGDVIEIGRAGVVESRGRAETTFAVVLIAILVVLALEALPPLVRWFHGLEATGLRSLLTWALSLAALATLTVASATMHRLFGWWRSVTILAVVAVGLALSLTIALYVADDLVYPVAGVESEPSPAYLVTALEPMKLDEPFAGAGPVGLLPGILLMILFGGVLAAGVGRLVPPSRARALITSVAVALGAFGGYALLVGISRLLAFLGRQTGLADGIRPDLAVLTWAAVVFVFTWAAVDVNVTSILGLYRDRLAAAYVIGLNRESGRPFVERDLDLEELCGGAARAPSKAPYQILNASLNMRGSRDPLARDQGMDHFMFSKLYCGGQRTGYCSSRLLERVFPQMDLQTAMTISAAASFPSAGPFRSRPLVALMVLLNIRLGYWLPHPGRLTAWVRENGIETPTLHHRWRWRIPPWTLLREMLSRVDESHRWVNVTDGGHVENLGVYELLRRRCRYIICGDAEADPQRRFGSLLALQRRALEEMGIEIRVDRADLEPAESGLSRRHWVVGRISYPPSTFEEKPETGHLLYVKPSLTGDESDLVREQHARYPAFPHETVAGQHLEAEQFGAYRELGYHSIRGIFRPDSPFSHQRIGYRDLRDRFEELRPSSRGVFLCYRRVDSTGWALLIEPPLRERFGADRVFRDVVIDPGAVFTQAIGGALGASQVVLVLIGARWLAVEGADGRRRLDDPDDHVRNEIVAAMEAGKRVIPLLLERTPMPREEDLPEPLKPLVYQNAVTLNPDRFDTQLEELVRYLEVVLD